MREFGPLIVHAISFTITLSIFVIVLFPLLLLVTIRLRPDNRLDFWARSIITGLILYIGAIYLIQYLDPYKPIWDEPDQILLKCIANILVTAVLIKGILKFKAWRQRKKLPPDDHTLEHVSEATNKVVELDDLIHKM